MNDFQSILPQALIGIFILSQLLYLMASAVDFHLYSLPVNRVDMLEAGLLSPGDHPYIVLAYPVLDELGVPARPLSRRCDPQRQWQVVWDACTRNDEAYWWHRGRRAYIRDLPPKNTRQLIYAFYTTVAEFGGREDFLIDYIDADSCPRSDHLLAAAVGIRHYDVLQAQNIAGNLITPWRPPGTPPHLSTNGRQPYWVLGKGT